MFQWQQPSDSNFSMSLSQPVVPTPLPPPLLGLAAAFRASLSAFDSLNPILNLLIDLLQLGDVLS